MAVVGEVSQGARERFGLGDTAVAAAEVRLDQLLDLVLRERQLVRPGEFPAVDRDINLVVAEEVPWGELEQAIRAAAGELLESCRVAEIWRDAERLGARRKSLLVALRLRSPSATLTGDDAAKLIAAIVAECAHRCAATLRG